MMNEKSRLRKLMKAIRNQLPSSYREEASRACCRQVLESRFYQESKWVYTYISFGSEVDTHILIDIMLGEGKRVAVPRIQRDKMEFYEIRSLSDCKPGTWGILEPDVEEGSSQLPVSEPGLMLLPGLAYDRERNRLGYGGGYYDKYLADHHGLFCCGLACKEQVIEAVPVDRYDRKVDVFITN